MSLSLPSPPTHRLSAAVCEPLKALFLNVATQILEEWTERRFMVDEYLKALY